MATDVECGLLLTHSRLAVQMCDPILKDPYYIL
jgi:hypothetical protein